MDQQVSNASGAQNRTSVERKGDRELVITRTFDAPPGIVYRAWSQAELFQRWWMPKSLSGVSLVACDMDVRTGGKYRLEFSAGGSDTMAFYGKYLEVVPNERIVWTNAFKPGWQPQVATNDGCDFAMVVVVTLEPLTQPIAEPIDRIGQIPRPRQRHDAQMVRCGPVESGALGDQDLLLQQQDPRSGPTLRDPEVRRTRRATRRR